MNYAILLSGGTGTRIGSDKPKQYVRAGAHMMVTRALKALLECDAVDSVYIVAEHEWRELIEADADKAGLDAGKIGGYAVPGTNRQTSILNGMQEIIRSVDDVLENCVMDSGLFYYKELPSLKRPANNPIILEALSICYELTKDEKYLRAGLPTFRKISAINAGGTPSGRKRKMEDTVIVGDVGTKGFAQLMQAFTVYYTLCTELGLL